MLEVMTNPHEDPRENQADAGGSKESGPNPDSSGAPESASDPRTVAEQSAPALATLLATRPPQPRALKRFLSGLFDNPDDVDAVIQEIEALSGERAQISIIVLESVLLTRLDAQDAKLDAQDARPDAQSKEISSLTAVVRAQGEKIAHQGEQIAELKGETRALRADVGALGVKLDSTAKVLTESIASLRRENRFMMALFAVLIALGIFGWLGEGCSRPRESNAGVDAAREVAGPGGDGSTLPAAAREPSAESLETDDLAEDGQFTEADGEGPLSDSENRRSAVP